MDSQVQTNFLNHILSFFDPKQKDEVRVGGERRGGAELVVCSAGGTKHIHGVFSAAQRGSRRGRAECPVGVPGFTRASGHVAYLGIPGQIQRQGRPRWCEWWLQGHHHLQAVRDPRRHGRRGPMHLPAGGDPQQVPAPRRRGTGECYGRSNVVVVRNLSVIWSIA